MGLFDTSGDSLTEKLLNALEDPHIESADDSPIENADIDCQPQNEYVTKENVKKIDEYLNPGEKVHYLSTRGALEIQGATGAELSGIVCAATDRRVVVGTYTTVGEDGQYSLFYENISGVGLKTGLVKKEISIQTNAETYKIGVTNHDKEECREFTNFIRKMSNKTEEETETSTQTKSSVEKIEKLNELKESGAISKEEFEKKKSELMDDI